MERVRASVHWARVGVWSLESGELLASLRLKAEGQLVRLGRRGGEPPDTTTEARVARARSRQAHDCSLGLQLRERIFPEAEEAQAASSGPAGK